MIKQDFNRSFSEENHFREVLEQLTEPAWVIRSDGSIAFANSEAMRLHPFASNQEPAGQTPSLVLDEPGMLKLTQADGTFLTRQTWSTESRWEGQPATLLIILEARTETRKNLLPGGVDAGSAVTSAPWAQTNSLYSFLGDYGRLLQGLRDSKDVFPAINEVIPRIFLNLAGALFTTEPGTGKFTPAAARGSLPKCAIMTGVGICPANRGRSQVSVKHDPPGGCCEKFPEPGGFSLCTPLISFGDLYGLLRVDSSEQNLQEQEISLDHLKLISTIFSSQTAAVLANTTRTGGSVKLVDQMKGIFHGEYADELLDMEIHRAARHGRPLSVMMVQVNVRYPSGAIPEPEAAWTVIKNTAEFLRAQIRFEDLAFRYSSHRFILVLLEAKPSDALVRAEVMRMGAKNLRFLENNIQVKPVSISVGVAGYPVNGADLKSILQAAQDALDEAESKGGDRVCLAE